MTNREYLLALLDDENHIDDGGSSYEAMVYYNIACPYLGYDERAKCKDYIAPQRNVCVECKMEWLDSEVDE